MTVPILFEDKYLIAAEKPPGMLSENGGMPQQLQSQCECGQVYCVHRLDKPVGGVMIFAKDRITAAKLSTLISSHKVKKEYLAVIHGIPEKEADVLHDYLFHDKSTNKTFVVNRPRNGVKEAELEYLLLQSIKNENGIFSLLKITLRTGRSHQIRAQFASRRLPLVGDRRYGSSIHECNIALQAHCLSFVHPITGSEIELIASTPKDVPWSWFKNIIN